MIGGNVVAVLQKKDNVKINSIGEQELLYRTTNEIKGFLDLSGGDSKYTNYNAKIQESTHLFICDYIKLDKSVKAENSRMIIDGLYYDIMLIDNPMNLCEQLEFYLKYTGGQ